MEFEVKGLGSGNQAVDWVMAHMTGAVFSWM
jgi:hypothetical protein